MPEFSTVISNQLLRSSRPGYSGGGRLPVKQSVVDEWIGRAHGAGVRSIFCLLSEEHLCLYPPPGLLASYQEAGFTVAHLPTLDHQSPILSAQQLGQIATTYQRLPKPVLIHCSAGLGRTGLAVDYILREQEARPQIRP